MTILQNNSSGSLTEICVAIAVAAVHCQALAVIGADLPISEFDGLLEKDVIDTRARVAAHKAAKARPLC
jgi:ABC-type antimicrobial peptide transport system permease subunit